MAGDRTLLVFGATGDLTGRLLLPALARLHSTHDLPERFVFMGAGPQSWSRSVYQDHARAQLAEHAADLQPATRETFLDTVDYRQVDVLDSAAVAEVVDNCISRGTDGGSVTLYLALPTRLLRQALRAFDGRRLPPTVHIAVEKPFGNDLDDAIELNAALQAMTATADHVFRVDHVLGLPAVQHLPSALSDWWQQAGRPADVAEVQILWEETLAL